jgi:hypothetical protein
LRCFGGIVRQRLIHIGITGERLDRIGSELILNGLVDFRLGSLG